MKLYDVLDQAAKEAHLHDNVDEWVNEGEMIVMQEHLRKLLDLWEAAKQVGGSLRTMGCHGQLKKQLEALDIEVEE